jgi:2-polyprenyl-6-methoxyphenol hydroxylase-like FAD-dependent oxidoreductase
VRNGEILISGAGIAGPALAYWLRRGGFSPMLIERAARRRTEGYMIDFWGVGYDVAERMGLLPRLHEAGYRIEEVRLVDDRGKRITGLDAHLFQQATHDRYLSLLRGDLASALLELVDDQVETMFGESVTGLSDNGSGVAVTFARSPMRRFDLVIGADGLHSNIRTLAFAENQWRELHLGYYAAAFTIDDYPHRDEQAYVSFSMPGRQVARYALRNGRSAFLFVFTSNEVAGDPRHDVAAQRAALHRMFAGGGWECDEILAAMDRTEDVYFDAVAQIRMPSWSTGRVALVGDAAFCPSLLAGQGSSFGMAGAYVLAQSLVAAQGDHALAFREYERCFKPFINRKQASAAKFGWWFAPQTRLGVWLRNELTKLTHLPFVAALASRSTLVDDFELPPDATSAL